ncbi:MAG: hypothetical protein R3B13_01630 [Polyangiaceae bacterium]
MSDLFFVDTNVLVPRRDSAEAKKQPVAKGWVDSQASSELLGRAFELEDRFALSFWDALIVSAAQRASCRYLLTEDLQDAQDFDGTIVVNPFQHERQSFGL